MSLQTTPSQTIGPYLHIGLDWLCNNDMTSPGIDGDRCTIQGCVIDGDGRPVNDAVIEIWQADAHGRYAHPEDSRDKPLVPSFSGFGRVATDDNGAFTITTIKPGPVPAPREGFQAPHLNVTIFARGLLKHLTTRMYFPDEAANAEDPVLRSVPADRRGTLIAEAFASRDGALVWNIVLQGERETVFFEY